ncbi:hypothetical protein EYF80_063158 [Liparis tanakae]|uniref:Uncharacterized protein n=1 Tax=Liparis tanakae TaxID=230148 RepID=A0A4Z2EDY4_9TELE|nr:hypothetical protein EYF80_063158 [Liparis tanakae]
MSGKVAKPKEDKDASKGPNAPIPPAHGTQSNRMGSRVQHGAGCCLRAKQSLPQPQAPEQHDALGSDHMLHRQ